MSFLNHKELALAVWLLATGGLTLGCHRPWLDPAIHEVPPSEFKPVAHPRPVHLIFEFQTFGSTNGSATRDLTNLVRHELNVSLLFSTLDAPLGRDSALLYVTVNQVTVDFDKSNYICTIAYLGPEAKKPLVVTATHAIFTPIDRLPPPGVTPMSDLRDATTTMTIQILSHALLDLSMDPRF
jgi:hypothetical protein